jgi:hypothetical protein
LSGEDTTDFTDKRFRLFDKIFSMAVGKQLDKEVVLNDSLLDKYAGVYSSLSKKPDKLTIYKNDGNLYMDLSNGTGKHMLTPAIICHGVFVAGCKTCTNNL